MQFHCSLRCCVPSISLNPFTSNCEIRFLIRIDVDKIAGTLQLKKEKTQFFIFILKNELIKLINAFFYICASVRVQDCSAVKLASTLLLT